MTGRVVTFQVVAEPHGEMHALVTRRYPGKGGAPGRTEERRERLPDRDTMRGWVEEMKFNSKREGPEMPERLKEYDGLKCWDQGGVMMRGVSMDFRVGESEAKAIVQAARLAPSLPEGSSVVLRALLQAEMGDFHEARFKRGPADVEVAGGRFEVRRVTARCVPQPVAPLAAFFGIELEPETDEEWWASCLPPGWRAENLDGRKAATIRGPAAGPWAVPGSLIGALAACWREAGLRRAGEEA